MKGEGVGGREPGRGRTSRALSALAVSMAFIWYSSRASFALFALS